MQWENWAGREDPPATGGGHRSGQPCCESRGLGLWLRAWWMSQPSQAPLTGVQVLKDHLGRAGMGGWGGGNRRPPAQGARLGGEAGTRVGERGGVYSGLTPRPQGLGVARGSSGLSSGSGRTEEAVCRGCWLSLK